MVLLVLVVVALIFFYLIGMPIWLLTLNSRVSRLETSLHKGNARSPIKKPKDTPATKSTPSAQKGSPKEMPPFESEEGPSLPAPKSAPKTPVMAASVSPTPAEQPAKKKKEKPVESPAPLQNKSEEKPQPVLQAKETPAKPAVVQANNPPTNDEKPASQKPAKKPLSFVELFSWVGGVILLLGVVLAIKYALERNLISATMRVLAGSAVGIALWVTGLSMQQKRTKITADTLCACGLCTCYSVWFASYYFYQKPSLVVTFVLLSLVALASFATAVKKNAPYIGILAQIIGFLTPFLFRTDTPHIWFFLVYTAMINIAAICAAIKRNWTTQLYTSLAFTFLCFFGIINKSSPLQLVFFPGIFSVLYACVSVQRKSSALLACSFVLTAIGLFALGNTHTQLPDNIPYLIGFSCFFAVFFGLLSFFRRSQELFMGIIGFCALSFLLLLGFPASFGTLLAFFTVTSLFFAVLSSVRQNKLAQFLSLGLTILGFISLLIRTGKTSLPPSLLAGMLVFAGLFILLFGMIAFFRREKFLLLGIMGFAAFTFVSLVWYSYPVWMFVSFCGLTTLFFTILFSLRKEKIGQALSLGLGGLGFIAIMSHAAKISFSANLLPPWLILFSGGMALLFGLIAFRQRSRGLLIGIMGFCVLAFFILVCYPSSFSAVIGFFGLSTLFFTVLSALRKDNVCLGFSLGLTAISFTFLQVVVGKSTLDPTLLPWIFGFACFFSLLFSSLSYKQQNNGLLLGTIGVSALFVCGLLPFKQVAYPFIFIGVFTACFGLLATWLKRLSSQLGCVCFSAFGLLAISWLTPLPPAMCFAMAALIFYGWMAFTQQKSSLWILAVWTLSFPLLCLFLRFWSKCPGAATSWYIGWSALAILAPHVFKKPFLGSTPAWISTALYNLFSGLLLVVAWYSRGVSNQVALALAGFHILLFTITTRWQPLEEGIQKIRLTALSWAPFGFLTLGLIFQFHKEYQILALALEGTALVWLWHKLKLSILQIFGVGVLALVFISLLFNPAIAHYHQNNPLFFNWYLYVYLACAAALFAAARGWQLKHSSAVATLLRIGGGILLFALVHIEIANYFSGGKGLHFHLCGEVAEAAAYTIAWALCGAICMFLSNRNAPRLLQVGIGLIGLAVFKLFISDFWQLSGIPKIIVLVGVAVIMLGVSFVYQKLSLRTKIK